MASSVRVADYIVSFLQERSVSHVFMVTGGGAMHLNDAFGRNPKLKYICCHHEQACTMAADSYYRMSRKIAAVNVTTGPGGTNAITGVYGAFVDSVAMIVISGQVKWETLVRSTDLPLRQLGDQEVDIVRMVEGITKYSVLVNDPSEIRYHLEKAFHLATSGRPGPVWLDIPINVQGALIQPGDQRSYNPKDDPPTEGLKAAQLVDTCKKIAKKLKESSRPVIMVGAGVRLSGKFDEFLNFIEKLQIPVVTCWNAHDTIWDDHPLYAGRPGTIGDRAGNFAVQNADFLLVLGSRLNIRQISYGWKNFARAAYKVMVDVDEAELKKPTLNIDLPVHADLKEFFEAFQNASFTGTEAHKSYLAWCKSRRKKYPVVLPEYWTEKNFVNPYCFVDALFEQLPENQKIVTGDGTACVVTFQAAKLKRGQRLFTNSGCAAMGFDLPAAIGAALAAKGESIVCIAGDGSLQMNVQELQTIVTQRLPIKIFVLNNQGYHSIRQTQQNYFADNIVGCGTESGLGFPDLAKLAAAYDIPYQKCSSHAELKECIRSTLVPAGPQMCEIVLNLEQQFSPKLSSRKLDDGRMMSSPLEDMAPFLSREELKDNMLIPPICD